VFEDPCGKVLPEDEFEEQRIELRFRKVWEAVVPSESLTEFHARHRVSPAASRRGRWRAR
jgi:hypothetical protein